ncbi:MAG TPA: hypothetical protein VMC06_00385 [Opitutaceae bacterium]|nr:hypothetical protein [Opitutaceae bacterium]
MIADEFARLRQLLRGLKRAVGKREAAEEEIDSFICYLEAFLIQYDRVPSGGLPLVGPTVSMIVDSLTQEKARQDYAAAGAAELKVFELPNGDYEFRIDGHRLKLSPRLGALLKILARAVSPDGASPDALVPWKSRLQVRLALATKLGQPITNHALNGLVFRLREELRLQINLHRDIVRVHPVHGLRFAVQRKAFVDGSGCDPL